MSRQVDHRLLDLPVRPGADDQRDEVCRPVPLAVVGAAPVLSAGNLLGLEHQVVPLAVGHDRHAAVLVALAGAVDQPDVHGLHVVGLDLQPDGGQVFHLDLLEPPHGLHVSAAAA